MAYLLLAISIFYTLLWGVGFVFSIRSTGSKQPVIPLMGLIGFIALGIYAGQASKDAMTNPHLLTRANYDQFRAGMTLDEVEALIGTPQDDARDDYDLGSRGIRIHPEITELLGSTDRHRERTRAELSIRIVGEAGPMGDHLVRQEENYERRVTEWERINRDFERTMRTNLLARAREVEQSAENRIAEAEESGDQAAIRGAQLGLKTAIIEKE